MTLDQLLAKFEGVLLSAPLLRADLLDMVQDERADEREQCALVAEAFDDWGHPTAEAIRNRNEKEVV